MADPLRFSWNLQLYFIRCSCRLVKIRALIQFFHLAMTMSTISDRSVIDLHLQHQICNVLAAIYRTHVSRLDVKNFRGERAKLPEERIANVSIKSQIKGAACVSSVHSYIMAVIETRLLCFDSMCMFFHLICERAPCWCCLVFELFTSARCNDVMRCHLRRLSRAATLDADFGCRLWFCIDLCVFESLFWILIEF